MIDIDLPSQVTLRTVLGMKKYLYFPILALFVVVGLLVFVAVPSIRKVVLLRQEISQKNETLRSLEQKVEVLKSLDENQLLTQVENLERTLPSRKDVFLLLTSLNGLASQTGVSLEQFSLAPGSLATASATDSSTNRSTAQDDLSSSGREAASSQLASLGVEVKITGSFEAVKGFLSNLEQLIPLMRLTTLDLSPASEETPVSLAGTTALPVVPEVSANFTIAMFYASLPTQLGTITEPIQTLTESEQGLYDKLLSFISFPASPSASVPTGREDVFAPF